MAILCICITHLLILQQLRRGIAQLVEHRSPKPQIDFSKYLSFLHFY